jgi:hypothetical protein
VEWAKELAMKVHTLGTTNMFATTFKKVKILSDQSAMPLFTMALDDVFTSDVCEYFQLICIEELVKLQKRLSAQVDYCVRIELQQKPSHVCIATTPPNLDH